MIESGQIPANPPPSSGPPMTRPGNMMPPRGLPSGMPTRPFSQMNRPEDTMQQSEQPASDSPSVNEQRPPMQPNPNQPQPPMPSPPNFNNSLGMSRMGTAFSEETPNNGILVGFAVTLKKWGTNDCIESIQPLYRSLSGTGQKRGTVHGNTTGESKQVFAPAGYAVGAINGRAVAVVDGFELVCMKIKPDGSLDPNDTKTSPWIGNTQGGTPQLIDGKGKAVTEIKGFTGDYLSSLELVFE